MNQTISKKKEVNGVDVTALHDTLNAVREKPELAAFKFRATNKWQGGTLNRSKIGGFYGAGEEHPDRPDAFVFTADEPQVLLGQDRGANPVEFLLHAAAACATTTMIAHAAARGIQLEEVESVIEGDIDLRGFLGLDPKIKKGFQGIRLAFRVKSDAPAEQLRELTYMSPVINTIKEPTSIEITVEKK